MSRKSGKTEKVGRLRIDLVTGKEGAGAAGGELRRSDINSLNRVGESPIDWIKNALDLFLCHRKEKFQGRYFLHTKTVFFLHTRK
jgi:hypothetical protein